MNRRRTRNYLSFSWYFLNKIEKLFSFSSIGRLPLQPFLEWQFVKSDFSNHGFSSFQPLDGKNDVLDIKLDSNRGPLVSEATTLPTEPQPLPNDWLTEEVSLNDIM